MVEITCCKEKHTLADGSVRLLGAVDRVTPTMTLVTMGLNTVLVDCGPPIMGNELPEEVFDAQAVLLTHAHNDHVGGLPYLLRGGFAGSIYGTGATLEIAAHLLADGIRLNGGSGDDVRAFAAVFDHLKRPIRYDSPFMPVRNGNIEATFREAGHILGSASIDLKTDASRVVISGDLGRPGSPILKDYFTAWPDDRNVDLALVESTYGDQEHDTAPGDIEKELERVILSALEDGGHILVPSFAIGRTQLLLYHLNTLVESGKLPDLPVAVDTPLGLKITNTYTKFRRLYDRESLDKISAGDDPLDFEGLYGVRRPKDSSRLRDVEKPMLIIAGSGMCTGGRILGHLHELLPRPETAVIFVGYQAWGSLGRAIQDTSKKLDEGEIGRVEFNGQELRLAAKVETIHGISAHADRIEIERWLKALPGLQRIAVHHGDADAQRSFVKWFEKRQGNGEVR